MSEPMSNERLEEIRAIIHPAREPGSTYSAGAFGSGDLLAEVDRLRAENAGLRAELSRAADAIASAADAIESLDGEDLDEECAENREYADTLRALAGAASGPAPSDGIPTRRELEEDLVLVRLDLQQYKQKLAEVLPVYEAALAWRRCDTNPASHGPDARCAAGDALADAVDKAEAREEGHPSAAPKPIPMILPCPRCKILHVDGPEPEKGWTNPPHRSHLCGACGCIFRPADVPTTGVASIETKGAADTIDFRREQAEQPSALSRAPVPPVLRRAPITPSGLLTLVIADAMTMSCTEDTVLSFGWWQGDRFNARVRTTLGEARQYLAAGASDAEVEALRRFHRERASILAKTRAVLKRLRRFVDRDEVSIGDPNDTVWQELAAIDHEIAEVTGL